MHLIENEKRIVSFIRRKGAVSKPEICNHNGVGCGWATAHKLVGRLLDYGVLEPADACRPSRRGRTAALYRLSPNRHCALGIDVEKTVTSAAVLSLDGTVLFRFRTRTPSLRSAATMQRFLERLVHRAAAQAARRGVHLSGVGIGLPFPRHSPRSRSDMYERLAGAVEQCTGVRCVVRNNVASYCDFLRYRDAARDFALIAVRTGIGGAVVIGNRLFEGEGAAGEFGHINTGGRSTCQCGKTGCLETEASLPAMRRRYARASGGKRLEDPHLLFARARRGDAAARRVARHAARHLARAVATLDTVLDLPLYIVAGRFRHAGTLLETMIVEADPSLKGKVRYVDIGGDDFMLSAAHLVHRDFLSEAEQ